MDDRLRETLSAMMDDEADELSVRRLLSHERQHEVRAQWQRWQGIRDLMHSSHSPAGDVDVSAAVREALDGRAQLSVPGDNSHRSIRRWHWPAVAMVAMALLVGFGAGAGWDASESVPAPASVVAATSAGDAQQGEVPEVALQGLDDEQWEQMSQYLLEHAQHNSVGAGRGSVGYARLASASGSGY